jgi:uncharacterized membrane protein required for colicin V production
VTGTSSRSGVLPTPPHDRLRHPDSIWRAPSGGLPSSGCVPGHNGRVNLFDVGVIAALLLAVISGWRRGVIEPAARWVGMAAAVIVAIRHTDAVMGLVDRLGVSRSGSSLMATVVVMVIIGAVIGSALGRLLLRAFPIPGLRRLDRLSGAGLGAAGVVFVVWMIGPIAALLPGSVAGLVREGRSTELAEAALPDPPDLFAPVRSILPIGRAIAETRAKQVVTDEVYRQIDEELDSRLGEGDLETRDQEDEITPSR